MTFRIRLCWMTVCLSIIGLYPILPTLHAASVIIDHTSIDRFSNLSDQTIDSVQANIRWHYAHTSHGGQLTTGLGRIETSDTRYDVSIGYKTLPATANALNIFDGQEGDTYIEPNEYWDSESGRQDTQNVLTNNLDINVSAWSWCTQLNDYDTAHVQEYLTQMAAFELANPDITFVYMTGNAQATGSSGYTRYANNELIRDWVRNSDHRVLFDFADLDAWWKNGSTWEQETYLYNGEPIPTEHSQFSGDQSGHTTYESTEQKGKAVWVMMADIDRMNAVPLPGSIALFAPALICLAGMARRQGPKRPNSIHPM